MISTLLETLKSGLEKKIILLDRIMEATQLQNEALSGTQPDIEKFDEQISDKNKYLDELLLLDKGFDAVYDNIKDEIADNKELYAAQIKEMQNYISVITDKSVKIKATEQENKKIFEKFLSSRKNEIRNFKLSSKTVANYYKNMTGKNYGQSYFMDKKK